MKKNGKCICVYASAKNTLAVRGGFEMGGYLIEKCEYCSSQKPERSKIGVRETDFQAIGIFYDVLTAANKAMEKFPQPNYVLLKIAEEAGEVVKTGVHLSEGRDFTWADLEMECKQTMAMCLRLLLEGDETIGLIPPHKQKDKT